MQQVGKIFITDAFREFLRKQLYCFRSDQVDVVILSYILCILVFRDFVTTSFKEGVRLSWNQAKLFLRRKFASRVSREKRFSRNEDSGNFRKIQVSTEAEESDQMPGVKFNLVPPVG